MGIRPWTDEAPHGDDRKLSPTAPSRLGTSTSEAVWIHIRTWWCWRALVAGDSPWNRKQFEGFGKLEKSWNLAETCSVLKALRLYGSGHWILQNGSTFQLWNLAASCNVSRCTKHLLELNAKPRRKAAILNLKYNSGRLPGTSSDQHDLWWVQSKDLGDVKLWSFWIFVK